MTVNFSCIVAVVLPVMPLCRCALVAPTRLITLVAAQALFVFSVVRIVCVVPTCEVRIASTCRYELLTLAVAVPLKKNRIVGFERSTRKAGEVTDEPPPLSSSDLEPPATFHGSLPLATEAPL